MPRFFVVAAVTLTMLSTTADAADRKILSGNVSGDLPPGEYLVKSAVTVRAGESWSVRAGTALYFEQLAGIIVFGSLSMEGEPDKPVALMPTNAASASIGTDWNGIETEGRGAAVRLRHVSVSGSVYGVNARDFAASVDLADVRFSGIGYAPLMIGGQEVPLDRDKSVNVLWSGTATAVPTLTKETESGGAAAPKYKKRLGLCAGAVGLAATGLVLYSVNLAQAGGEFDKYVSEDDPQRRSAHKANIRRNMTMGGVGAAIAGAGLVCVGLVVFF